MLTFEEKIIYLENRLSKTEGNYYDNFKEDIVVFLMNLMSKTNAYFFKLILFHLLKLTIGLKKYHQELF